jgi:FkbM family methyltransferase
MINVSGEYDTAVHRVLRYGARAPWVPWWIRAFYVKVAQRVWNVVSPTPVLYHCQGLGIIKLRPWDLIGSRVFFYGTWEPVISDFVRTCVPSGAVVVDIGANIGYYSLLFSRLVGPAGQVYAVEPSPSIRSDLNENIDRNGITNVVVVPYGVSNRSAKLPFYLNDKGNLGKSHFGGASEGYHLEAELEVRRLCEVIDNDALSRTALIKIDVEGMENEVLEDVIATLPLLPLKLAILAEVRMSKDDSQISTSVKKLCDAGFAMYVLENRYDNDYYAAGRSVAPQRVTQLNYGQVDVAFVRSQ